MGEDFINDGHCWEIAARIYCVIFRGEGVAVDGVRDCDLSRRVAQKVTLPSL